MANTCQLVPKADAGFELELLEKEKLRRTKRALSLTGDALGGSLSFALPCALLGAFAQLADLEAAATQRQKDKFEADKAH